jgi:hypothetical protein
VKPIEGREMDRIHTRIYQIATEQCKDYPDIETTDSYGQLWAIESTMKGINDANKDLRNVIEKLRLMQGLSEDDIYNLFEA